LSIQTKRACQSGSKHLNKWYKSTLRQTRVDAQYCLDQVVPEGMSQVSRRSEVRNHERRTRNTRLSSGTFRKLSHVPRGLRQGWVLFETNVQFQWNPVYKRRWRLSKKGEKKNCWYPAQKKQPGPDGSNASGDSVGRFRRYWCSTLINYHSNLAFCGTFLQKSIHLPDNRRSLVTPKKIYDLNLSAVTLSIWSFRTPTSNFCTKDWYNPGFFLFSLHPRLQGTSLNSLLWKQIKLLVAILT